MKILKFILPLTILNLIALILITFGLPDIVPIHINLLGVVDAFGSRWFIPIIGLIPVFMGVICKIYIYNHHVDLNKEIEDKIIPAIAIILIPFTWIPAILALIFQENINSSSTPSIFISMDLTVFVLVIIAIFFVFLSYYIKNIKQNWFMGIRTPWTLKNESVWKKTHKLGMYTFRISGLVLLAFASATFITKDIFHGIIGLIIAIIIAAAIPIIYSYTEFKKIKDN